MTTRSLSAVLLVLLLLPLLTWAADQQPLRPDQAFKFTARADGPDRIQARWIIANGYYLYQNKFHFSTDTPGVTLGDPQIPPGEEKHDPTFGVLEVHRHEVTIEIPVQRSTHATGPVKLVASAQGCADMGLCYPPYQTTANVQLPPPAQSAANDSPLGGGFGVQDAGSQFLPAGQAFDLTSTTVAANGTIKAQWKIAEGYYLYRDKFHFKLLNPPAGVHLGQPILPKGQVKNDPSFGKVVVYHHGTDAKLPVLGPAAGKTLKLQLTYQGCASAGLCYPPIVKSIDLQMPAGSGATGPSAAKSAPAQAVATSAPQAAVPASNEDRFSRILQHGSLATVMLAALGFGVLLAFTACMYPMIPILSSIIVGQGEQVTVAKGFGLSLLYVESLAVTFGLVGAGMALFGGGVGIQAAFQTPLALIPFALLFVVLALSMFGFFNIQMPAALQSRLSAISNRQKGGTLIGVSIMGILSALIIGPCGGPILIAALAYAASSAKVVNGFLALFALGNGMGLPLLLVGLTGGALLPRAGDWMNAVKAVAGVILLAVAIDILGRMPHLFPPTLIMLLWAALLIVSGIYMGALTHLGPDANGWRKLWKGIGLTTLFYGFIVMLGGVSGGTEITDPLHGLRLSAERPAYMIPTAAASTGAAIPAAASGAGQFKQIKTVADLQRALAAAKAQGKTAMLDFSADWCTYCKQFESYVFPDPAVQRILSNTVWLQADVTDTNARDKALMKHVGVFLPPAVLFFDTHGREMRRYRVIGYMPPHQFEARATAALKAAGVQ